MKIFKRIRECYSGLSTPAKAAIIYLIVNLLQKGLAFLTSPIFTRLLTMSEYGKVAVFFSWQEVIGIIAMFCLQGGVFNNGMVDFPDDRDTFCFSLLAFSNVITVITGVCYLVIYGLFGNILDIENPLMILMFFYFLLQPALGFWTTRQRYEFKYRLSSVVTLLYCFSAPIVSILCILFCKGDAVYERLFGYEITIFVFCIVLYVYLAVKAKGRVKRDYWKYAWKFNIVLIPHYLSSYVLSSSDRIMIDILEGAEAAGMYSLAYSISAILVAIWGALNSSLIPFTYESCKRKDYKKISNITSMIILGFFGICVLIILVAPELLMLISTKDYYQAVYVVPAVMVGVFFQSMYFIFANVVYYYKKPQYVMVGSLISAGSNIILNYLLIPKYGFIAAGYTTVISYVLQAVIDYWAMCKVVGEKIYNVKFLILLAGIGVAFVIVAPFIYTYLFVRYVILLVLVLLAFFMRRRIMGILRMLKGDQL